MTILCTGSVAVDHIMVYQGRFKDVILPDKIHILNVAFHVPKLDRSFGGVAANIAYGLRVLGEDPIVLATVGADDFEAYAAWLDGHGVRRDHIVPLAGESTAGAYITTDLDDNQITAFHPGAMDRAHEAPVSSVAEPIALGIVSPNGKQAMIEHARALKAGPARSIVDPGQALPLFDRAELTELLEGADLYIANDYEWQLTRDTTGLSEEEILGRVGALIVTLGERGSLLYEGSTRREIPAVAPREVVDPTGCGDAYRAGLLYALSAGQGLYDAARVGSTMGSLLVERPGTQPPDLRREHFDERFESGFGSAA
jgi:adenosine kinase